MPTVLPTDSFNQVIPAVRLKESGAHTLAPTTTIAARNTVAFDEDTRVVSVYATEAVYLTFGGPGVTATAADHYFPADTYYDFSIGGPKVGLYTHLSALCASADGNVYISEKE
ncbi:MAG: hypothetical protein KDJ15_00565 [Alphaproteobacteria bacterium]|nr:hypothetical protein [Alphaproteobacteria bacterium]